MSASRDRIGVGLSGSVVFVGLVAAGGLVLGVLAGPFGGWVVDQDWVPAQALVDQVLPPLADASWLVRALVGVVFGGLVGLGLLSQARLVEVGDAELRVVGGSSRERVSRAQVTSIEIEGRRLSVRGADDADLVSEKVDCDMGRLVDSLRDHHWPLAT